MGNQVVERLETGSVLGTVYKDYEFMYYMQKNCEGRPAVFV